MALRIVLRTILSNFKYIINDNDHKGFFRSFDTCHVNSLSETIAVDIPTNFSN